VSKQQRDAVRRLQKVLALSKHATVAVAQQERGVQPRALSCSEPSRVESSAADAAPARASSTGRKGVKTTNDRSKRSTHKAAPGAHAKPPASGEHQHTPLCCSCQHFDGLGFVRLDFILKHLYPVSRSTFYKMVAAGLIAKPVRIGLRVVAWRNEDIRRLLESPPNFDDASH
jgi:predicted DNA-binding transcriptional regulator AlpA